MKTYLNCSISLDYQIILQFYFNKQIFFINLLVVSIVHEEVDSELRHSFFQILSYHNEPEYRIIGWSEEDRDTYFEVSRTIGGLLFFL